MNKQCGTPILIFMMHIGFAQNPEPILSYATNPQSIQWYKQQLMVSLHDSV